MNQKTLEDLTSDLKGFEPLVKATIGLDTGRMMKSATHIYFVAKRYGGWEVIEESLLSEVSKVEKKSNFLGDTYIFHTKSGRWTCKEVEEDIDLRQWMSRKGNVAIPKPTVQSEPSPQPFSEVKSQATSQIKDDTIDDTVDLPSVVTDSFTQDLEPERVDPFEESESEADPFAKPDPIPETSLSEVVDSSASSSRAPENASAIEVLTQTFTPEQSHFDRLNTNKSQPDFHAEDPLPDELQSVLKALTAEQPPALTEEERLEMQRQAKLAKERDELLTEEAIRATDAYLNEPVYEPKAQNTIDETEGNDSGFGGTIVKWVVFYWIFSSIFDVCS